MSETKHKYVIRLEAEGGKVVGSTLEKMGADGKKSFQSLESASQRADDRISLLTQTIVRRLVPAVSAAAMGRAVRGAVKDLGDLADQAEKVGASAESLQVFRLMGKDIGEGAEAADAALQEFIKRVGQAQAGTGKLLAVAREYNIALKDGQGNNRAWAAVMADVADVIASTADSQEQLRIAAAVGMEDFVAALRRGSAGMKAFEGDVRQAGLVVDEQLVKKADEFDKAWSAALYNVEVRFKTLSIVGIAAVDGMLNRIKKSRELLGGGLVEEFSRAPEGAFDDLGMAAHFGEAPGLGDNPFARRVPVPPRRPDKRVSKDIDDRNRAADEAVKKAEREAQKTRDLIASLEARLEVDSRQMELTKALRDANVERFSEEGQQIEALIDRYHDFQDAQRDQELGAERMEKQWEENKRAAEAYGSAINDVVSNFDDLRSVGLRALGELAESLINLHSGGEATGGLGGLLASAIFGSMGGMHENAKANIYDYPAGPYLPGRAAGGGVGPGWVGVVGERGPEILRLGSSGGHVTPNDKAFGPKMVIEYIDARGADREGLAALQQEIKSLNGRVSHIDMSVESRSISAVENKFQRTNDYLR